MRTTGDIKRTEYNTVPAINQEFIRPDGHWMWRYIGDWTWNKHSVRPSNCVLRFKRGRFYVYHDELLGVEYAYRY